MIGFSTAVFMGQSVAAPLDSVNANNQATTNNSDNQAPTNNDEASISKNNANKANAAEEVSPVTNGVSQKLARDSKTANASNKFLPTIKYTTDNLSVAAQNDNRSYIGLVAKVLAVCLAAVIPLSNSLTTIISLLVAVACILYIDRPRFIMIIKQTDLVKL